MPTVYGVSPAVMPADPAWPASVTVAGHFLTLDPEPVIPDGLPDCYPRDRGPGEAAERCAGH